MTWMLTASGQSIDLAYINPDNISIDAVAWSLANINRFNGHASRPISQAEHSVAMCTVMREHFHTTSPAVIFHTLRRDLQAQQPSHIIAKGQS
jgi:hypothetical protein